MDISRLQGVLTPILLDEAERRRWELDPLAYARSRLDNGPEATLIASLDVRDVGLMAERLQYKGALREAAARRHALRATPGDGSDESHQKPRPHATAEAGSHAGDGARPRPTRIVSSGQEHRSSGMPVGLAYRPALFRRLVPSQPQVDVWELTLDHFIHGDEVAMDAVRSFAGSAPIALHSLDLSVGSEAARHDQRLERKREIIRAAGVDLLSDHLAFSRTDNASLPHFVPLWRLEESLELVVGNVDYLQGELGVQLALENVAMIFDPGGELGTAEFLNEVTARTGCGIHLDITNMTINDANGYLNAAKEFEMLDLSRVLSCHLAGGECRAGKHVDSHAFPVSEADLDWLRVLVPRMPNCRSVVIERDNRQIGTEVVADLERARAVVAPGSSGSGDQIRRPAGRDGAAVSSGVERGVVNHRRARCPGLLRRGAFCEDPNVPHARMRRLVLEDARWRPEPPTMLTVVASLPLTSAVSDELRGALETHGIVKVRPERPATTTELIDIAGVLGEVLPVPAESDLIVRHTEAASVLHMRTELPEATAADRTELFSENALMLHTERALVAAAQQPTYLLLDCLQPPPRDCGNQTLLAKARSVRDQLQETELRVLSAIRQSPQAHPIWSQREGVLRFRDFGSQPSPWLVDRDERMAVELIDRAHVALLRALYGMPVWGIDWRAGDMVLFDNRLWLHGRSAARASSDMRHLRLVKVRACAP